MPLSRREFPCIHCFNNVAGVRFTDGHRPPGRVTHNDHILAVLSDGEWHRIEDVCALPSGGTIMEPHRARIELRRKGWAIESRQTMRSGYRASDWRLAT